MATAAILKLHKQAYLGQFLTDLCRISCAVSHWPTEGYWWPKISLVANLRWLRGHNLGFCFFSGHFWIASEDICVKFVRRIDIGHMMIRPTSGKIQDYDGGHIGFAFSAISRSPIKIIKVKKLSFHNNV